MEKEKLISIGVVVVIVVLLSALIVISYGDVFGNIFGGEKVVEEGDCVDIHYVGRYTDDGVFGYSYENLDNKSDGTPLNIYIASDPSASAPEGYGNYSNNIVMPYGEYYNEEFINGLKGLKEGDKVTIGPISADESYGVRPEEGDVLNLTSYAQQTLVFSIYDVEENVNMPSDFLDFYQNITTNLYKLRDESYYIGEVVEADYLFWTNSTIVTKINETTIWKYTTPQTSVNENFTYIWSGIDSEIEKQVQINYPINSSYVSSFNESTIVIKHDPSINSNITMSAYSMWGYTPYITYNVRNVTEDKINTSYVDPETNSTKYKNFNRTITLSRNETQSIINEPMPGESLEQFVFYGIRDMDSSFVYGYNPFTVSSTFEVEVVKIYKTSES